MLYLTQKGVPSIAPAYMTIISDRERKTVLIIKPAWPNSNLPVRHRTQTGTDIISQPPTGMKTQYDFSVIAQHLVVRGNTVLPHLIEKLR